ncbi:DUF397 domain-containing protein [Streptomyces aurantiogriseus]|uniref:DUF397 domain-containing protein n=1 Tax=Streptomyces aurantiogriseus TaxID=66870 RepID=A0A918C5A6_9ACTN|nr:DUF397 domain-containing protein [Streptomyces aurantiogriseus]GGR07306.1 hypothetical protein GCM10010251_24030 [Streptomyces aurantiogriseus]
MASHEIDLSAARWRKSSYSNGTGGDCVEVADSRPGVVPVRDSKRARDGDPVLLFRTSAWAAFLTSLQSY